MKKLLFLSLLLVALLGIFPFVMSAENPVQADLSEENEQDPVKLLIEKSVIAPLVKKYPATGNPRSRAGRRQLYFTAKETEKSTDEMRYFNVYRSLSKSRLTDKSNVYLELRYQKKGGVLEARQGKRWVPYQEHGFLKLILTNPNT